MLSVLQIKNLAIVDSLQVEFSSGLNVLTGETGAGKSIVLKAIDLLTGAKEKGDIVRNGAVACEVEGLFSLSKISPTILENLSDQAQEALQEEELIIRRVIDSAGKSKCFVNGRLASLKLLEEISSSTVDLTGQHQQQRLLTETYHRQVLDDYGVLADLLAEVSEKYAKWLEVSRALEEFSKNTAQKEIFFRQLAFEVEELEKAKLRVGEKQELEIKLKKVGSVETLGILANEALSLLESEEGIGDRLGALKKNIQQLVKTDPSQAELEQMLLSSLAQINEINISLSEYVSSLEADPQLLEQLRQRISEISRLERKYSKSEQELVDYFKRIKEELSQYQSGELDLGKLKEKEELALAELRNSEVELSKKRKKIAIKLEKQIETELAGLNMNKAKFQVLVESAKSSKYGADRICFMISANPGEPFKELSKVASGGELSRVLLVLKTLLNEKHAPGLQVYDEVDAGIGGAVAQVVGEKLKKVSQMGQVLIVTHSPQIAAFADHHFVVSKTSSDKMTNTNVRELSSKERVKEIARMLAGKEVSKKFEESAKELLLVNS